MISAVVVAAGNSLRYKEDKMFLKIGTLCVIEKAILPFINSEDIEEVIVVTNEKNNKRIIKLLNKYMQIKPIKTVTGGATRAESVQKALAIVASKYVLIHDGARPNITQKLLKKVIEKTQLYDACVPIVSLKDSIRNEEKTLKREAFFAIQTPQGYNTEKLKIAYNELVENISINDDSAVYERLFGTVTTIKGEDENIKITYPVDYLGLKGKVEAIGIGYDVHRLKRGQKLILGGVEIPFDKGLVSHSDGDILTHSIIDALLTAIKAGDIGQHFPNTAEYFGVKSIELLEKVNAMVKRKKYVIKNLSAVVIAEAPKLAKYIPFMVKNIAKVLNIDEGDIGIAATTTEGLGVVGKKKGMAAKAIVCLISTSAND